jgi:uracil-DNA glycosylase family 4
VEHLGGQHQLPRDEVYICNVVKCRLNNRNPEPDEIEQCEPFLKAQLAAIRPKVIVALGKFAADALARRHADHPAARGLHLGLGQQRHQLGLHRRRAQASYACRARNPAKPRC